ncbi:hypothetical protein Taro_023245 [Colocasia esculenta]|uniref:Uncharacterized protein n=1 Tax=Colocasia esculenta TaxID=4460 RepID=A0A843V3D2_COLES|nr:hypothetical protein [Colocasia esculenta]
MVSPFIFDYSEKVEEPVNLSVQDKAVEQAGLSDKGTLVGKRHVLRGLLWKLVLRHIIELHVLIFSPKTLCWANRRRPCTRTTTKTTNKAPLDPQILPSTNQRTSGGPQVLVYKRRSAASGRSSPPGKLPHWPSSGEVPHQRGEGSPPRETMR